jgi:peptidoglycan/xylan/chitin deacetylase (PgdA/CDA1 family)
VLGPLDLAKVKLTQSGRNTKLLVKTRGRWRLSQLDPKPKLDADRPDDHLCLELGQDGRRTRSCFGTSPGGKPIAVQARLTKKGRPRKYSRVELRRIRRPNHRSLEARGRFRRIGLRKGRFRWRALSGWDDRSCYPEDPPSGDQPETVRRRKPPDSVGCLDRAPDAGRAGARIRQPRIVGCSRDEDQINYRGSGKRKRVALTFDDGPSSYTSQVVKILDRYNAKGTFFMLGGQVGGRAALLRRMVRRGHEIGNHSSGHSLFPSSSDLRAASHSIKRASGFTPCTFRPTYGGLSGLVVQSAWQLGMSSILWDIDTNDWSLPGSGSIVSRALGAGRGSIVLMHDGGGYRGQTVAALPQIVKTLRKRGYRLVTVSRLLNERVRWKP